MILTLKRYLKYYAIHAKKYLDIFGDIARNEYIDTETQETLYIYNDGLFLLVGLQNCHVYLWI